MMCVFYRNLKKSHPLIWLPEPQTPPGSFSWCPNVTVPTARTPFLKTSVLVRLNQTGCVQNKAGRSML